MPGNHAILSASSAHRWIHCPPSVRLSESIPDRGSGYAVEGTDAHTLCEYKLRKALGMDAADPTENLTYYDQEMEECANGYAAFVLEQVEAARKSCLDPVVLIEQRVDFSRWVPDGFGTADCLIVADKTLTVVDFKYGVGVLVSAEGNPQMGCYCLGALELYDALYDIDTIRMAIYQPRRDNLSVAEMSRDALLRWADETLKPAGELAYAGKGEFCCGEWCGFCKAKTICRARADANMELARYEFKRPPLLSDEDVEEILSQLDDLAAWASDIRDYALHRALSGKEWRGWKLVEGRSNRRYTDEDAVAEAVRSIGLDPFEKQLIGITAMEKLLGKARFNAVLSPYIEKPQGKPTLVPESDKRPAIGNVKTDFTGGNGNA